MARFVWRGGEFVCRATGVPMLTPEQKAGPICAPMIMSDIPDYYSVASDQWISGRAQRREDLKRTGSIEMDPPKRRPLKNARFANKHGLPLGEETRAKLAKV